MDYFTLFGLPVRYTVDGSLLASRFQDLQRQFHPDRFANQPERERLIAARQGQEVIRLQAVYSALAMGGGIAVMTVIAGFLFEYWQGGVFWVMAAVAVPALFIRPPAVSVSR